MLAATKALTVIAEIDPTWRAVLDARLATIDADLDRNAVFCPKDVPHTHFMRFVIVEDPALPTLLVWESNHDYDASVYLAQVVRAAPAIDKIFECCRDYPAASFRDDEARVRWLLARSVRAAAFYCGYRGVSRDQVVNDRKLHDALREEIDRPGAHTALSRLHGCEIQRQLRERVRATRPDLDTTAQGSEEWRWLLGKVLAIAVLLVLFVPLILVAIPSYFVLRAKEKTDPADENTRPVHDDKELARFEDKVTQNQLTHIVDIKPGGFRLGLLTAALTAVDVIARVYAVRGNLGGIISIHFARWVIVKDRWSKGPKRHRLLFFSNYDGSWESYLGEFVDRAAYGLTGIWSNTVGFPRSEHLLGAGARDEEAFKQWTRRHQIATQVWWSGVKDSTVQNVRDDIWIRRNLDRGFADDEVNRWLRKL